MTGTANQDLAVIYLDWQ